MLLVLLGTAAPAHAEFAPPPRPEPPEPPREAITFAVGGGELWLPVEEVASLLGWEVQPGRRATLLAGRTLPRRRLRRQVDGTPLVRLRDLRWLGARVTWQESYAATRVELPDGPRFWARAGAKRVEVNQGEQRLRAWQGERLVLVAPVSTGRRGYRTPNGHFRAGPLKAPMLISRRYNNAPMPWSVQVRGDVLIHGSASVPRRPASHGCVRLPLSGGNPARWFYEWVCPGTPISIGRGWPHSPRVPVATARGAGGAAAVRLSASTAE